MEKAKTQPVSRPTETGVDFLLLVIVWYPQFMHTVFRTGEV